MIAQQVAKEKEMAREAQVVRERQVTREGDEEAQMWRERVKVMTEEVQQLKKEREK